MKRCLMSSAIRGMKSKITVRNHFGLPCWSSGYESPWQRRVHGFDPWSGKMPRAVEQLSPCATTTDPHSRACARKQEKPLQWEAHTLQRVAPALRNQRRPSTTKRKKPLHRHWRWLTSKRKKFCAEHGEINQNPHALLVGRQNGAAAAEDRLVLLPRRKHRAAYDPATPLPDTYPRENVCPHRSLLQGCSQQVSAHRLTRGQSVVVLRARWWPTLRAREPQHPRLPCLSRASLKWNVTQQ